MMANKPCEACGKMMQNVNERRVFCAECTAKKMAERNRAYRNEPVDKHCEACGESLVQVLKTTRFCPACRKERQCTPRRRRIAKATTKITATIHEVNEEAKALGMSYGQYEHMKRMERLKQEAHHD